MIIILTIVSLQILEQGIPLRLFRLSLIYLSSILQSSVSQPHTSFVKLFLGIFSVIYFWTCDKSQHFLDPNEPISKSETWARLKIVQE